MLILLFPDLDGVTIRPLHQAVEHFDDINAGTQRRIDRGHFEADDAAADDQHFLRHEAQFQCPGRIDDARIVRQEGQMHRRTTRRDDALLEADDFLAAGFFLPLASGHFHGEVIGIKEAAVTTHDVNLARLGHTGKAAGQLADDFCLVGTQFVDINLWRGKTDAAIAQVVRFLHHRGDVQQGLGGNAADIEANTAQGAVTLDDNRFQTQIGGTEGRRITARASTEDEHVTFNIGCPRVGGGRCCHGERLSSRCSSNRRGLCFCRLCSSGSACGFHDNNDHAFGKLVTDLDAQFLDDTRCRGGNIHRRLVRFEGQEGVIDRDRLADSHRNLDHRNVGGTAEIRHLDFHELTHRFLPIRPAPDACRRAGWQYRR